MGGNSKMGQQGRPGFGSRVPALSEQRRAEPTMQVYILCTLRGRALGGDWIEAAQFLCLKWLTCLWEVGPGPALGVLSPSLTHPPPSTPPTQLPVCCALSSQLGQGESGEDSSARPLYHAASALQPGVHGMKM